MTKSNLFTKAHSIAKTLEGDYRARFSYALTVAWKELKNESKKELTKEEIVAIMENQDAKTRVWEKYGKSRIYVDGFHYSKSFYIDMNSKEIVCNRAGTWSTAENMAAELVNQGFKIA